MNSVAGKEDEDELSITRFDLRVDAWEKDLLDTLLRRNNVKYTTDEEYTRSCDQMLAITEDEIKRELNAIVASIGQGHIESESLRTALVRIYVKMRRRKRMTGFSERMRRTYDTYILKVLKILYMHLESISTNPTPFTVAELACKIYDEEVDLVKFPLSPSNLTKYQAQLWDELVETYPAIKKQQKAKQAKPLVYRTREQLEEEAR
jgi:hypothetical protein